MSLIFLWTVAHTTFFPRDRKGLQGSYFFKQVVSFTPEKIQNSYLLFSFKGYGKINHLIYWPLIET
jgi:hypothetical protein